MILALTWWSLRSLRYALVVFLISLFYVGLCFLSLSAWGDRMNLVLIVMPLLVLTLGMSGGIHLVNLLTEAAQCGPPATVAARAIRVGWLPCSLSAGTTAMGLASLIISELEPIRVFGFHAAVGATSSPLLLFLADRRVVDVHLRRQCDQGWPSGALYGRHLSRIPSPRARIPRSGIWTTRSGAASYPFGI